MSGAIGNRTFITCAIAMNSKIEFSVAMKALALILLCLFHAPNCYSQRDSVEVIVHGNYPREKFKFLWDSNVVLSFKGTKRGYFYKFKIPFDEKWKKEGYTYRFTLFRKGFLSFSYKEIGTFNPGFEDKKYLIIHRNPYLKKGASFDTYWSDKLPRRFSFTVPDNYYGEEK
jgi:hypothetical protein